jgi:hypothetical protein
MQVVLLSRVNVQCIGSFANLARCGRNYPVVWWFALIVESLMYTSVRF